MQQARTPLATPTIVFIWLILRKNLFYQYLMTGSFDDWQFLMVGFFYNNSRMAVECRRPLALLANSIAENLCSLKSVLA